MYAVVAQGMEGVIHEEGPELRPALSDTISLANLGPQQMPRLWSALHDALLYNDPNKASGGKVGHVLCRQGLCRFGCNNCSTSYRFDYCSTSYTLSCHPFTVTCGTCAPATGNCL